MSSATVNFLLGGALGAIVASAIWYAYAMGIGLGRRAQKIECASGRLDGILTEMQSLQEMTANTAAKMAADMVGALDEVDRLQRMITHVRGAVADLLTDRDVPEWEREYLEQIMNMLNANPGEGNAVPH